MKKLFLLGILGLAVIWLVGWFIFRVIMAFVDVYDDWQLGREVREIEAEAAERRKQKTNDAQAERERLQQEARQIESGG